MKKILSLVLAIMLLVVSTTALAVEPRASLYFNSYYTVVSAKGGGKMAFTMGVTGVETSIQLGVSTFQLQKKVDGKYVDVGEEQTGSVGYNVIDHSFSRECTVIPGEVYRVRVTFVCENSNGYKAQTYYSSSKEAK